MVKARFADLTDKQIREAHAYAYGGSLVQDAGLLPVRQPLLQRSDALRAGLETSSPAQIQESQTANEYAFALGALWRITRPTTAAIRW